MMMVLSFSTFLPSFCIPVMISIACWKEAFSRNSEMFTSFTASSKTKFIPESWDKMEKISFNLASLNFRVIGLVDFRFSS